MTIRFLLICEGTSDAAFVQPIRRLLVQLGYDDPQGMFWTKGKRLTDKIALGLRYSGKLDLLLIHRDADALHDTHGAGPTTRLTEIENAVSIVGYSGAWVGVIPVQTIETWLILDPLAIRRVVGRPGSDINLELPLPSRVEYESNPKSRLSDAIVAASGATGRRLAKVKRDVPQFRRRLLEGLPVCGVLDQVPSWARFKQGLIVALASIQET